jgi:hypothetical protein
MALQLASESLGEREGRDFQRRRENPPSPATERRLLLTAKCFHTVCYVFERQNVAAKSLRKNRKYWTKLRPIDRNDIRRIGS